MITLFDCDVVETPPVCFNGNDVAIGTAMKDPSGHFVIPLATPLKAGQLLYVTDACFDPPLSSAARAVSTSALVSAAYPLTTVALIVTLGGLGALALRPRLRR